MAQYFTSFLDDTVGQPPNDFSSADGTSVSLTAIDAPSFYDGKGVTILKTSGTATFIKYLVSPDTTDSDVIARFKYKGVQNNEINISCRNTSEVHNSDGYFATYWVTGGTVYVFIWLRVNGQADILGNFGTTSAPSVGTMVNLRFQVTGSELKYKYWLGDIDSEPTVWGSEVTNNTITSAGSNGLYLVGDNLDYDLDLYAVGTDGSSAPTEAPEATPAIPINLGADQIITNQARLFWSSGQ